MNKSKKVPVGKRFDKAVNKVDKKIDEGKDKIIGVKEDISDAAHNIGKSVKKAVQDSGDAISGLIHKK